MPFILTSKSKKTSSARHALKGAFLTLVSVVLFFNEASPACAEKVETHPINKECEGAKLLSTSLSFDSEHYELSRGPGETIQTARRKPAGDEAGPTDETIEVTAAGPILGSMDSHDVDIDVECTSTGVALTAFVTRSADYHDAVQHNVPWRPRIRVMLVLHEPEIVFQAIWRMRLTTGVEVNRGRIPPFPEEKFPLILSQKIR